MPRNIPKNQTENLQQLQFAEQIPDSFKGTRLDAVLAKMFPDFSRARLQKWIQSGEITIDGKVMRPRDLVAGGEQVLFDVAFQDEVYIQAEAIELNVVYEDEYILVIDKPAGLVVHPGAGNPAGTLANALLHYDATLRAVPRVGIVHRLDKDTSGLLMVAKQLSSHANLVEQLQQRSVTRKYVALVHGEVISGGTIDEPIARHPVDRKRMAVKATGKTAITHYRVEKKYAGYTLLDVNLETGRTHQIRVHMAHLHFPIVGDPVYGRKMNPGNNATLIAIANFPRQALHAASLSVIHPHTQQKLEWSAPLPEDFLQLLAQIEQA